MILEALAGYLWLYEPLPSQKAQAARDLLASFGREWVKDEDRHFLNDATCAVMADGPGADEPMIGMGGREITAVWCSYRTSCGVVMERPIWHEPILGAYTTADTVAEDLARQCPGMLRPEVLERERGGMDQGG